MNIKYFIVFMLVLQTVSAADINIGLETDEDLNAEIDLNSEGNSNVWVNGNKLTTQEDIDKALKTTESGGSVRNGMIELFRRMSYGFVSGKLFTNAYDNNAKKIYFYLNQVFLNRFEWQREKRALENKIERLERRIERLESPVHNKDMFYYNSSNTNYTIEGG